MSLFAVQIVVAFVFGVAFIVTLILLAIRFPRPTPFQYNVFRTVLSLAAAGVAAMVPGFIDVQIGTTAKLLIRAGGALAVFVIVFFFNPAKLAAHGGSNLDNGGEDDFDLRLPPDLPKKLRNGDPFTPSKQAAFFYVWESLLKVDRAGEDLWHQVSDRNLSNFADRLREAKECVENNALFFSADTYASLERMIGAANFYLGGKVQLLDIRTGMVLSDRVQRLARPGEKDLFTDHEVRHQIEQNKRWLTRYRTLLRNIRSSFHSGVVIESDEVGRVTPL
jgi:hypothetical protein